MVNKYQVFKEVEAAMHINGHIQWFRCYVDFSKLSYYSKAIHLEPELMGKTNVMCGGEQITINVSYDKFEEFLLMQCGISIIKK